MSDKDAKEAAPDAEENKNENADPAKDEAKESLVKVPEIPDPFAEAPYEPTEASQNDKYNLQPCCCCLCACSHERVGEHHALVVFQLNAVSCSLLFKFSF